MFARNLGDTWRYIRIYIDDSKFFSKKIPISSASCRGQRARARTRINNKGLTP